jgi:hypothetical protein
MEYMLLIYSSEADFKRRSDEENQAISREYLQFTKDTQASGHYQRGDRLQSVETATSVRIREGKVLKTDGPFAETREQLAGYYLISAKDHDEACALAARLPGARLGTIEVRPIVKMPGFP